MSNLRRHRRKGSAKAAAQPLAAGAQAHLAGDHATAERQYRKALAQQPRSRDTLYYLSALLIELERPDEAWPLLERAAGIVPDDPAILANLATVRRRRRDWPGAQRAAEAVLAHQEHGIARYNRALAAREQGAYDTARADLDALLAGGTDTAELRLERGLVALADEDPETAADQLARSLAARPSHGATAINLAIAYNRLERPGDAWATLQSGADFSDSRADWHTVAAQTLDNLAEAEDSPDRHAAATAALRAALEQGATRSWLFFRLAAKYEKDGALARAEAVLRQGLNTLAQRHAADESLNRWEWAGLYNNLGTTLREMGRIAESLDAFEQALALDPDYELAAINRLLVLHYDPEQSAAGIYAAHRAWQQRFAAPLEAAAEPPAPRPADGRPLRVGILGAKLRLGPALLLYLAAFENLDPDRIELAIYDMGSRKDSLNARLQRCAVLWREVTDWDDSAVADRMRADNLDVLINKMGHAEGRMGICARKPAPVQVQWGGFNTTALDGMDWFLGDPIETPPGCESDYTESIYRLPDDYVVYLAGSQDSVPVGPLPQTQRGFVTFGCLNAPAKINGQIAAVWARLLAELPDSRLVLRGKVFDDPDAAAYLVDVLAQAGIPRERLVLYGWRSREKTLATYNEIDIGLDSWPYSGGLTTIEAMWMGVPVVTLPGPTFVGRHAASHLTAAGLGDWVVADWDGYIDRALSWAQAPEALAQLRAGLRDRLVASPLCDGPRFARNLEGALQDMWQRSTGNRADSA